MRDTKFGKSRELALHPSTVDGAARATCDAADRPAPDGTTARCSLDRRAPGCIYWTCSCTFVTLLRSAPGSRPARLACRPRLHDLRHTFAVETLLDAYRDDATSRRRLALLSHLPRARQSRHRPIGICRPPRSCSQLAAERLERHSEERR